jgi:hypothetical protein
MDEPVRRLAIVSTLGTLVIAGGALGCDASHDDGVDPALQALMDDGDASALAPGAMVPPAPTPPPDRFCPNGDCTRAPLAFWRLDDCNMQSTELADTAFTTAITHPAFRAVSAACVDGVIGQGVRLAGKDDIVYSPDQPDYQFSAGLTAALWVNPDRLAGTQTLVRKRLDGTSSFLLAIDGRRVHFVLRLTNGRLVDVSAPIQAGRFTHVAGTYDGTQAILYLDGAAVATQRRTGTIAPGVGPIFVGNDANGRQLKGVVDEIWLNTLAAPADQILRLTCIPRTPVVAFSPSESQPQIAGTTVPYDLTIQNPSSAACGADTFVFFAAGVSSPIITDPTFGEVEVGPGETSHNIILVHSSRMAAVGTYPFQYIVFDETTPQPAQFAQASYVVGAGPVACDGVPPQTAQIIGSPFSPAGSPFSFAGAGLAAPVVTPVLGPDGSTQALQVSANPGVVTDPSQDFMGFGLGFGNPPCVDASRYIGVQFTVTGDVGTCALSFSAIISQDNNVANGPEGTCTGQFLPCIPPSSGPLTTGTSFVRFADMSGGVPLDTVDPTALNGVQWNLTPPADGVTAPCVANVTVSDVRFVTDPNVPDVTFTFDTDTQGWFFNQFNGPPFTNIAVQPGGAPPVLAFNGSDGDPNSGSLSVSAPFTGTDQYVDAITSFPPPGHDMSGRTLHARVRLASGDFPFGGVQLQALSGPGFVFAGTFVNPDQFPLGVWVPVTLDLTAAAASTPGFDPTQIVQIGVQFFSGFSSGGPGFTSSNPVFEIDTVTD